MTDAGRKLWCSSEGLRMLDMLLNDTRPREELFPAVQLEFAVLLEEFRQCLSRL